MKYQSQLQSVLFSLFMIAGGALSLKGDFSYGAVFFAFSAIFSSSNTPWQDLASFSKILISLSTIFGIGALIFAIVF